MTDFKTPQELVDAYSNGLIGSVCDLDAVEKLLSELPMPLFGDAAFGIKDSGKGKLSLPFLSLLKFDPGFGPAERQTTSDCVSHATRNAVDVTRAHQIVHKNQIESFLLRGATEGIYGSRGHGGHGMSCAQAARFVSTQAGVLLRKRYGNIDLSSYNGMLGARWGSVGVPRELVAEARKNPVKTVSLVRSVSEARDAIANGYALSVCSNFGFSSTRDKNGIAARKGSWNHALTWIACDDTRSVVNECIFLVQNSWGLFNGGPKLHGQPDGSFWIREQDAAAMLAQNGSWVFSDVVGFPPRPVEWTLDEVF